MRNSECGIRNAELGIVNSEVRKTEAEEKISEAEAGVHEKETPDDPEAGWEEAEKNDPEGEKAEGQKSPGGFSEPVGGEQLHEPSEENPEQSCPERESAGHEGSPGSFPEPDPPPGDLNNVSGNDPGGEEQIYAASQPEDDPTELSHEGMDGPFYLEILRHAFARSTDNEDGKVIFTTDEICYLAHDPDFARIYPDQAADMRRILAQLDG